MVGVNTNISLQTRVRVHVLYDVVKNLAFSFGFPVDIEKTLEKGIRERQYISSIIAYYIGDNEKAVGKVSIDIDWKTYELFATTDTGKEITTKRDIPLLDQFANWARDIVNYIGTMQEALHVKRVRVFFRYRDEIRNNSELNQEADKYLGLRRSLHKIEFDTSKSSEFERHMRFQSEFLPEISIIIESNN